MRRDRFDFKQFSVANSRSPMPLTTDSVLVGAWCDVSLTSHVLDVGTGCGIISLMLAQRNHGLKVDSIDIDPGSVNEAIENVRVSPWSSRISVFQADFNDWEGRYDLIVSNPPFFNNGVLSPRESRASARHTLSLTINQLIKHSVDLLSSSGRLVFIAPYDISSHIIECATFNSLSINRMCDVVSMEGKPPKRVMWELSPESVPLQREKLILRDSTGAITDKYRDLCGDFYLNL